MYNITVNIPNGNKNIESQVRKVLQNFKIQIHSNFKNYMLTACPKLN